MEGNIFEINNPTGGGSLFEDAPETGTQSFETLFGGDAQKQSEQKVNVENHSEQPAGVDSAQEPITGDGDGILEDAKDNNDPPILKQPIEKVAASTEGSNEKNAGDSMGVGPLAMAMVQQEIKEAGTVFEKPAVFSYDGTEEDIADPNMTFEDLRVAKAADFPVLDDPKKVTWVVNYGKTSKKIFAAKTTSIGKVKKEIEMTPTFLAEVKADRKGELRCIIKPTITAQTKGKLADYKGLFVSEEEARESDKKICLFPGSDGLLYELRKSDVGEFITPAGRQKDLGEARVGFNPTLPLVPYDFLTQTIDFFRAVMDLDDCDRKDLEALVNVYWDTAAQQFALYVPKQVITHTSVESDLSEGPDENRYIHYMDIHSHNNMAARFSDRDDRDEKATRIYTVIGRLDKFYPDITVRLSNAGKYQEILPDEVFEAMPCFSYDPDWKKQLVYQDEPMHQSDTPTIYPPIERVRNLCFALKKRGVGYEI